MSFMLDNICSCFIVFNRKHDMLYTDQSSYISVHEHLYAKIYLALCAVAVLLVIVGKGMFESTVIQFGTD